MSAFSDAAIAALKRIGEWVIIALVVIGGLAAAIGALTQR